MKTDSKLLRLACVSPWPFLIFFCIPLLVILTFWFPLPLPHNGAKYALLVNNSCFALFVAFRLLYYLLGLTRGVRYGATHTASGDFQDVSQSCGAVRETLAAAGFHFDAGRYGEKHDLGYLGTTVLYAGLLVVLCAGTYDNVRQFSGTLLDGIGVATDLNQIDKYREVVAGPFASAPTSLPKMKIVHQYMPDARYPRGATEVAFRFPDDREQQTILKCPEPFRAGAFDVYMSKMVYEPKLSVTIDNAAPVFSGAVLLDPLVKKENGYGFYGAFVKDNLDGEVWYQPETNRLRMVLRQGPLTLLDKELVFQVDRLQTSGNISFSCERLGVWSELHVVRRRHFPILFIGGFIALLGLVLRLAFKPQRVWLEDVYGNCRVEAVGKEALQVLQQSR